MLIFFGTGTVFLLLTVCTTEKVECPEFCTCETSHELMSCENITMTRIPHIPQGISYLDIVYSNFRNLTAEALSNITEIRYLRLSHDNIQYIEADVFKNNLRLWGISLSYNYIEHIPHNIFRDQIELFDVHLSHNRLSVLPGDLLEGLSKLQVINLSHNKISILPENLFYTNKNLDSINLAHNLLSEFLFSMLANNQRLDFLYLENNKLSEFRNFKNVHLISTIDYALSNNTVESHKGDYISPNFTEAYLRKHIISNTNYNEFYVNIQHYSLAYLSIYSNNISEIRSTTFFSLFYVRHLNMSHNRICRIYPKAFKSLPILYTLDLSHNLLSTLPDILFSYSLYLQYIDLSHNCLRTISGKIFSGLFNLDELNMANNPFKKIDSNVFFGIKRLNLLILSNIRNIPIRSVHFRNFTVLRVLKLINCSLNYKNFVLFDAIFKIPTIDEIILDFNPVCNKKSLRALHELFFPYNKVKVSCISGLSVKKEQRTCPMNGNPLTSYSGNDYLKYFCPLNCGCFNSTTSTTLTHELLKYTRVSCIGYKFANLPENLNPKITELVVQGNIQSIRESYFETISDLKYLDLSRNSIKSLSENVFHSLKSLETLDLSNNNIRVIHPLQFENMKLLRSIFLHKNSIETVNSVQFNLPKLEILTLSHNELQYFDLTQVPHLIELHINYNRISSLGYTLNDIKEDTSTQISSINTTSNEFEGISSFKLLKLEKNEISTIPGTIFQSLLYIEELDISHNIINTIPCGFLKNSNCLKKLYIGNNNIRNFSMCHIYNLKNLTELNVDHNILEIIDGDIFSHLLNLKHFDFSNNHLIALTKVTAEHFKNLRNLFISNNPFTMKIELLEGLNNFKILDLSNTSLGLYSNDTFSDMKFLRTIILSYNSIKEITELTFSNLTFLEYLNLAHNYIYDLHRYSFRDLQNLEFIDLSYNKIHFLDNFIFENNYRLKYLNVSCNSINFIPVNLLSNIQNLKHLNLSFNYIQSVDAETFKREVEVLDISNNELECIFNAFNLFSYVGAVNLKNNSLKKFQDNLTGTYTLHLSGSEIVIRKVNNTSYFSPALSYPRCSIYIINLKNNPELHHRPGLYRFLWYVTDLDLENTGLSVKSLTALDTIFNIPRLKILNVKRNPICKIHGYVNLLFNSKERIIVQCASIE